MLETHTYSGATWVRLINPSTDQLAEVAKKYDIAKEIISDIVAPTPRQKIETYENAIYTVFHIPAYRHSHTKSHLQEVDFIIGKDFIVTVQYDSIDALQKLSKEAEAVELIGKEESDITPGIIFIKVLEALYASIGNEISHIEDKLKNIEENIFAGREKQMVKEISRVGRDLLDIKRTLTPQRIIFENLLKVSQVTDNKKFSQHARAVYKDTFERVYEQTQHNADLLVELRETNNSLVSTSQNEVMKVLTIMAFITFPLTLVTGIFGMNTVGTPVVGNPSDFWLIIGFMAAATLVMFMYFKFKKWL